MKVGSPVENEPTSSHRYSLEDHILENKHDTAGVRSRWRVIEDEQEEDDYYLSRNPRHKLLAMAVL